MRVLGCLFVVVILVGSLGTCGVLWIRNEMSDGREAADEFHELFNSGSYVTIYSNSDPMLAGAVSEDEFRRRLGQLRTELGTAHGVSDACFTVASGSDGKFVRMEFVTAFEQGEAWETFDWRSQDGELRLLAYAVATGWEDGSSDWELFIAPRGIKPQSSSCAMDGLIWWER